jgi:hypothetical protein
MILGGDITDNYQELLDLPKEKSILSVRDFSTFQNRNGDVACWISAEYMTEFFRKIATVQMPGFLKDIEGTYLHAYLHFENGEMKAAGKLSPQSKVDEFLTKYPVLKTNLNNDLLEDFPETSFMSARFSVNWMEYMKLIDEAAGAMGDPSVSRMLRDPSMQKILNTIEGNAVLSIYGFAQGPLPLPLLGLSFSIKDKNGFDQILSMFPPGSAQKSGDYYIINLGMGISVYMARKNDRILLTDDVDLIAGFAGKGLSKALKNNEYVKNHAKDPCFFYINMDMDAYPENIKTVLYKEGPEDLQNALNMLSIYKDMSYSINDRNEVTFSLRLKDNSQNSLKLLLKNMDDISKSQLR